MSPHEKLLILGSGAGAVLAILAVLRLFTPVFKINPRIASNESRITNLETNKKILPIP